MLSPVDVVVREHAHRGCDGSDRGQDERLTSSQRRESRFKLVEAGVVVFLVVGELLRFRLVAHLRSGAGSADRPASTHATSSLASSTASTVRLSSGSFARTLASVAAVHVVTTTARCDAVPPHADAMAPQMMMTTATRDSAITAGMARMNMVTPCACCGRWGAMPRPGPRASP